MATEKATVKKTVKKAPKAVKAPKKASSTGDFAVIQTGGKQYVVRQGQTLKIEKLSDGKNIALATGGKISFDKVLLQVNGSSVTVGTPHIAGAKVEANVKSQGRAAKILVMKYKQKSRYMKRNGHRQPFTEVTIASL